MHCFTSCWRLVDGREDSLDLASRVSSILLELGELEVFLLSWPGPSQSSSPGSSPGKYSSDLAEASLAIALEGISCDWLWCKQMKSCLCILETIKPLKVILDSAMASKMRNIDQKKNHFFTQKMVFIQKKSMVSRGNQTLCSTASMPLLIIHDLSSTRSYPLLLVCW